MSKKTTFAVIAVVAIVGSLTCFYATNLILTDVLNMFYMTITKDCISSLPMLFIALELVAGEIGLVRFYARPQFMKAQIRTYAGMLCVFSVIGIVTSILSGTIVYPSMLVPYPFKGALIIWLVWHAAVFVCTVISLKAAKSRPLDADKKKGGILYILYNVALGLFAFYTFNRFGAFLLMGSYAQLSSLYITFPLYIMLILPMALLINAFSFRNIPSGRSSKRNIIYSIIVLVVAIACSIYIVFFGMKQTIYVSAVSPAMPIERMLTLPISTALLISVVLIFGVLNLVQSIACLNKNN